MKTISIGKQDFESLIENEYFFIDKSDFIDEWWAGGDDITLITRPRRFGKTLNMSMLNCFFSNRYHNRADLFENLNIWKKEKYRKLQGTYPVIFMSFASVKENTAYGAKKQIKAQITKVYEENKFLLSGNILSENEKNFFNRVNIDMEDVDASIALNELCSYLNRYYEKKVIILLDEYDTPMQEAYVNGYWDEFTSFVRNVFNSTFKTNKYLERAIMTGITRISKESVFSDLNNLNVVTTTSKEYETSFGFTESEVFDALDSYGLSDKKQEVKMWYDGFVFGTQPDVYNPWSITNYLDKKVLRPYWAATSSNNLVNAIIQKSSANIKTMLEKLIKGESIEVNFDEQIVFNQLDSEENAIWSLLLAGGYVKTDKVEYRGILLEPWYTLSITNRETLSVFAVMVKGWFSSQSVHYNEFVSALLRDNLKEMNIYMNDISLSTFSNFDTGNHPSKKMQPERFYHGFVLGLLVELMGRYDIKSNGESGYGRYDIMLVPLKDNDNAIIIEFKVMDTDSEKTLNDTADAALDQIEEKAYDTELLNNGVEKNRIKHYGFAFSGKKVIIK